jgi:hypothetical protein
MAIQPQVTAPRSRRRLLVLAATGVAVVALALLGLRSLLLGGVEEAAPTVTNRAVGVPPTTTSPSLIAPNSSTGGPSGGAAGTLKDPFQPLVAGGASTSVPGASSAGATTTTIGPSQSTVPGAGGSASLSGSGPAAGRKVTLLDVFGRGEAARR